MIWICACKHHHLPAKTSKCSRAAPYLLSDEMDVEWEAVTAGEGMWWPGLLSLVIMGDSVFTVLDDAVPGLK